MTGLHPFCTNNSFDRDSHFVVLQILNVDLSHIESKVGDILKRDRNIILLQGELIDK